ncbi:hypothetical protein [Campylobacter sp. LR196d]|nr:hypothetical protein [Campylobacter sp. LR196d]
MQIFECFSKKVDADTYVFSRISALFIIKNTIKRALKSMLSGKFDSAFSAYKLQRLLWKSDKMPLNFDDSNILRTQDLEPL